MRKPAKTLAIFLILAALVGGGAWYYGQQESTKIDPNLKFAAIQKGNIEEVVTAQGKLEPKEYVDVGAQVSGQLKKLHVEIGDDVKKGDLLAEIDPKIFQTKVDASRAELKTLEAQLLQQQAQVILAKQIEQRNERLIKSKAISTEALEDSQTNLKVAIAGEASLKAQVEAARSTLEGNETSLSYAQIYAPMDGTITTQPAREGQTLNANQTAPLIMQVANLDIMTVRAQVAEADVMRLNPDMPVYFTTLGSTERRWQGKVRQILPSPEVINDVVLYNALVDVENKDRQLMNGMSTQMFFVLGSAKNVPLIPVPALGKRLPDKDDKTGQAYKVRVKTERGVAEKIIHIGRMNRTIAEVREGLSEGDEVAVPQPAQKPKRPGGGMPGGGGPRL